MKSVLLGENAATLFTREFALVDRVALVTGGNRGLGLEMALALIEAGARAVYCVDLPQIPGEDFQKARDYADKMKDKLGEGRLEYISANVTDQVPTRQSLLGYHIMLILASHLYRKQCGILGKRSGTERTVLTCVWLPRVFLMKIPTASNFQQRSLSK